MTYVIQQVDDIPNWETIEPISISEYNWGGDYRPNALAKFCYRKGHGFLLQISCEEKNPKAVYFHDNEPVYKDSCLEIFMNFKPQVDGSGYINFECNANGALLCEYGKTGRDRIYLKDLGFSQPNVKLFKNADRWGYELFIPFSLIQGIYGDSCFQSGDILKGNFFKCGDDTQFPHYGSWTKIKNPTPSFHLSAYFGDLVIG